MIRFDRCSHAVARLALRAARTEQSPAAGVYGIRKDRRFTIPLQGSARTIIDLHQVKGSWASGPQGPGAG